MAMSAERLATVASERLAEPHRFPPTSAVDFDAVVRGLRSPG